MLSAYSPVLLLIVAVSIPGTAFCKDYTTKVFRITSNIILSTGVMNDGCNFANLTVPENPKNHYTPHETTLHDYEYKIQPTPFAKKDILTEEEMLPYRKNLKATFTKQGLFQEQEQTTTPGMVTGLGSGYIDIIRYIEGKVMLKWETEITKYLQENTTKLNPVKSLMKSTSALDENFRWEHISNSSIYFPKFANYLRGWKDPTVQEDKGATFKRIATLNLCDVTITPATKATFMWYTLQPMGEFEVMVETKKYERRNIQVERRSFLGPYLISVSGHPLNPMGATGIIGLGQLFRYGPNHAADLLLYRYKRNAKGETMIPLILEGLFITRRETNVFAFIGGFVDGWDNGDIWLTIVHELFEEAFSCLEEEKNNPERFKAIRDAFDSLVDDHIKTKDNPEKIFGGNVYPLPRIHVSYQGYSDDRRNTDNAWIETTLFAVNVDGTEFNDYLKPIPSTKAKTSNSGEAVVAPPASASIETVVLSTAPVSNEVVVPTASASEQTILPSTGSPNNNANPTETPLPTPNSKDGKYCQAGDGATGIHWKDIRAFLTEIKRQEVDNSVLPKAKEILFAGHASILAEFVNQAEPSVTPPPAFKDYNPESLQKKLDTHFSTIGFDKLKQCPPDVDIRACSHHKYVQDTVPAPVQDTIPTFTIPRVTKQL